MTRDYIEGQLRKFFPSAPYVIIEPELTVYHRRPRPQFLQALREMFERPVEAMPEVFIAAEFVSLDPVRDLSQHASVLVIGWFQRTFPPILNDEILPKLQAIDWDSHAQDFCW